VRHSRRSVPAHCWAAPPQVLLVRGDDIACRTERRDSALAQPQPVVAQTAHGVQVMGGHDERHPPCPHLDQAVDALALKVAVAYCEDLVHQHERRVQGRRRCEAKAHQHPSRVGAHRTVQESAELSELAGRFGQRARLCRAGTGQ
jgi:hypothetical protein